LKRYDPVTSIFIGADEKFSFFHATLKNKEGRFAVFDWAAVHNGFAGEDLGRIIFFGLMPELRKLNQDSLVELYHKTLLENVAIEYSLEQCWKNIRQGLLYNVFINTIGAARQTKESIRRLDATTVKFNADIYFGRLDSALRSLNVLELLPV
jgi:hypothetical protein